MASSALTMMFESELSDGSEEFDLMQHQRLLDEERNDFLQYHTPMSTASENAMTPMNMHWDQQQWRPLQPSPMALTNIDGLKNDEPNMSCNLERFPAVEENIQECLHISPLNPLLPPAAVPEAVCLMVEDPYFDTPLSSPSSEETPLDPTDDSNWTISPLFPTPSLLLNDETLELSSPRPDAEKVPNNDEIPPPLPERTPESYILDVDAELSVACERLALIYPPNAEIEAVGEFTGSPPSPAPPLPERTPESFELATEPVPEGEQPKATQAVNMDKVELPSEWFTNSTQVVTARKKDERNKSARTDFRFSAPALHFDFKLHMTSNPDSYSPHLEASAPPLEEREDSLTPPLPDRTPESFIHTTGDVHDWSSLSPHLVETTHPSSRVGMSSEWDGTSQSKSFLNVVKRRSKSVRTKSSKQEPLAVFQPLTPIPVVAAEGGSAQVQSNNVNHSLSLNAEKSLSKSDKSEKGMSRTKSLKFFKKQRPKTAPPSPPIQPGTPPQSHNAFSTAFKFGFGNRFGKPKGPRTYPDTWV